jgi:hypothetical protein
VSFYKNGAPSRIHSKKDLKVAPILIKPLHVHIAGERSRAAHPEGWISVNCKKKVHWSCYSLACACSCHAKGLR